MRAAGVEEGSEEKVGAGAGRTERKNILCPPPDTGGGAVCVERPRLRPPLSSSGPLPAHLVLQPAR